MLSIFTLRHSYFFLMVCVFSLVLFNYSKVMYDSYYEKFICSLLCLLTMVSHVFKFLFLKRLIFKITLKILGA